MAQCCYYDPECLAEAFTPHVCIFAVLAPVMEVFFSFSVFLLAAALCYARLIMPVYFQMDAWLFFFLCLWHRGNFLFVFVAFELLNLRYYGQRACYVN